MPSSQPPHQPDPPPCSIIPPYLLEALASSDDPHLAAHAQATLDVDAERRQSRRTAGLRPSGPMTARPRPARGTAEGPQRAVHDAKQGTSLPGTLVRAEGDPDTGDREVTEAYDGLGATWRLWQESYGRNSLDGKGLPLVATVHFGTSYDNAFWDGTQMVFGDGDGVIFLPFTRSVDVIGHELAHGVTQYTSGLNYQDQSGALNESVSDVFGVLVKQRLLGQSADQADWLVGAELLAPGVGGVAIRSMAAPGTAYDDPRLGKDPQPGHLRDYVDTTDDNGGVHINSGIPNKAFHVVATTLGGNAWEVAGQVWVDTITGDISADCDFATFARLTVAAATARHGEGSEVVAAVQAGWDAVGVAWGATAPATPGTSTPTGSERGPEAGSGDESGDAPGPSTEVIVRRTGGFAGRTLERTVALGQLSDGDARAWQSLLADDGLPALAEAVAGRPRVPDAFCYGVRCARPPLDLELPEPELSDDVRSLLERTLGRSGG
ncbi:MAG TPA: protealysin inhibitor emfourin [Ornithinibacter sp.]|nr:protealysin inhibitor emfourin [Ornithinibacter sp.]